MARRLPNFSHSAIVVFALSCSLLLTDPVCGQEFRLLNRQEVIETARGTAGSPYIPIDSWIYPAVLRLHDLGFLPTLYVGLRPYTRVSLAHVLTLSRTDVLNDQDAYGRSDEAVALFDRLYRELAPELRRNSRKEIVTESSYARVRGISGRPLADSFHLGQSYINDYGRPFQEGVNGIAGASGFATMGRVNLYVRGEYRHSPAARGYDSAVAEVLKTNDQLTPGILHPIIPEGPIARRDEFRLLNANASVHVLGHQVSFGRSDDWLGPGVGASMAWSTNAEPIYAFRIDRVEPIYFPFISRVTGAFRYEFFVGSLKGHDTPNSPWVHMEKASFKPHPDLEFGFQRSVIWGGKGHVPVTIGTFVRSFVSPASVTADVKFSRHDPGARFSTFDVTYRIPWKSHLFIFYTDSFVHDNVFPISNFRRAALRPGIVMSRLPGLPKVDLRVEGATTDPNVANSQRGSFLLYEAVFKNGYTNRQFLLGDPVGREDKGGNAWLTWHKSAEEEVQLAYRQVKAAKDFVLYGTTQNDLALSVRLRPAAKLEVQGALQGEIWRAPLIRFGTQHNVSATLQITWFPNLNMIH